MKTLQRLRLFQLFTSDAAELVLASEERRTASAQRPVYDLNTFTRMFSLRRSSAEPLVAAATIFARLVALGLYGSCGIVLRVPLIDIYLLDERAQHDAPFRRGLSILPPFRTQRLPAVPLLRPLVLKWPGFLECMCCWRSLLWRVSWLRF